MKRNNQMTQQGSGNKVKSNFKGFRVSKRAGTTGPRATANPVINMVSFGHLSADDQKDLIRNFESHTWAYKSRGIYSAEQTRPGHRMQPLL